MTYHDDPTALISFDGAVTFLALLAFMLVCASIYRSLTKRG